MQMACFAPKPTMTQRLKYFEKEPEPGTPEAGRFDFLASIIEDYECKHWAI